MTSNVVPTLTRWTNMQSVMFDRSTSLDYPSPFLRFESYNLPSSVKSLFRLLSYTYLTDSHINPVIENIAAYPVTDLLIEGATDEKTKKLWEHLLEDILKVKHFCILKGLDYYLYGNSASSLYIPFIRYLTCKTCNTKHALKGDFIQWKFEHNNWKVQCKKCNTFTVADAEDVPDRSNINGFKLIRWNIYNIQLKVHPYSKRIIVNYEIPTEHRKRIIAGDKFLIAETPLSIIKQVQYHQAGKGPAYLPLDSDAVFIFQRHMPSMPSEELMDWGMPLALPALRQIYFKNIMMRAQAMVLHEHIIPFRIFYPVSPTGDPLDIPAAEWKQELLTNYKKWLRDPSHIMTAGTPTQLLQVGGQGKALTLFGEIQETNREIIKALNVPREFVEGGLQYSGSSVSLRMLENIMINYTKNLNTFLKWVVKKISEVTGLPKIEISLLPFKMADDIQQKHTYISLWQSKLVSAEYLGQLFGFDPESERKKIIEESQKQMKDQAKAQALGQALGQKVMESVSQPMPNALGITPNVIDPGTVTQNADALWNYPSPMIPQILQQIGQQDPMLAKYLADRFKNSPHEAIRILTTFQQLPPQIVEQLQQDIRLNDPIAAQWVDLYNNMMQQQQQTLQNTGVDMRPNPEQKPPRRSKSSI